MDHPFNDRVIGDFVTELRHMDSFPVFMHHDVYSPNPESAIARMYARLLNESVDYIHSLEDDDLLPLVAELESRTGREFGVVERSSMPVLAAEQVAIAYLEHVVGYRFFDPLGAIRANPEESRAIAIYPELAERIDADGLVEIDATFTPRPGGLQYGNHVLRYHEFFRRNFSGNLNFDVLGPLLQLATARRADAVVRVAIDWRRLTDARSYREMHERDGWHGPPFSTVQIDDPTAVGLTRHRRNPNSLFAHDDDVESAEFHWSYSDGLKTFQAEEIRRGVGTGDLALHRYAHAIRDVSRRTWVHFDGAVVSYQRQEHSERASNPLPTRSPSFARTKLFRIDGELDTESWSHLMCMFFRSNELVVEYLNPEMFKRLYPLRVRDTEAWKAAGRPEG